MNNKISYDEITNFEKVAKTMFNIVKNNVNIAYFNLARNRECLYFAFPKS